MAVKRNRIADRIGAWSFDHGQFYENQPTTADITVTTGAKRTGVYGLDVNAQSGVSTALTLGNPDTVCQFDRAYINLVSIPSSSRIIWSGRTGSLVSSTINVRLKSDGHLELRQNTTVLGTSASALTTGRWYCVELGVFLVGSFVSLRVDQAAEIDWVAGTGTADVSSPSWGAIDTVAAAFHYYLDDAARDTRDWCGAGRVKLVKIADVVTDNATWALTGSTKVDAVDPHTTYDDTTYISCATASTNILFGLGPMPTDAVEIYGMQIYSRAVRSGASNGGYEYRLGWRGGGGGAEAAHSTGATALTSPSAAVVRYHSGYTGCSIFGPYFPKDYWSSFCVGLRNTSANGTRITALWVEVDYGYIDNSPAIERTLTIADFEEGTGELDATSNGTINGTATSDNARAKFGSRSLKLVHASGGKSNIRFGIAGSDYSSGLSQYKTLYMSAWVYISAQQSSGQLSLLYVLSNTTYKMALNVDTSGAIHVDIEGSVITVSAAGVIPANTWKHVSWAIFLGTNLAFDTHVQVYVDDILIIDDYNLSTLTSFGTTDFGVIGSFSNVTGGATVFYDGYIQDITTRHTSKLKFKTLVPVGTGADTSGGVWSVVGPTNGWEAIDDLPNDGDTSYILTTTATSVDESYATTDLPASAQMVIPCIRLVRLAKRDGGTNGGVQVGIEYSQSGITVIDNGAATGSGATTSAYAASSYTIRSLKPFGKFTPVIINGMELYLKNTVAQPSRVSAVAMTVAYYNVLPYPAHNKSKSHILG